MADSMVIFAPVDLLSIIHQAAERPIPPQLFGAGEVATPALQAQMLELHLQRQQLMAATAEQLHKLQQQMHILHSAAASGAGTQHDRSAWQPPAEEASAATGAMRQTHCSGAELPTTASGTQQHPAAEHTQSPTAVGGSGLPATEASPLTQPLPALHLRSSSITGQVQLQLLLQAALDRKTSRQPATLGGIPRKRGSMQPRRSTLGRRMTQQLRSNPALPSLQTQHISPSRSSSRRRSRGAGQRRPATGCLPNREHTEGLNSSGSTQQLKPQPQLQNLFLWRPAGPQSAPNRYAMLPETDSPSGPSSLHIMTAVPSSNEAAVLSAAAAFAVSAPSDGGCLADAAVQTPRLLMLPGASAAVDLVASSTSTAAAASAEDPADTGKPCAAVLGKAVDMSPPHPSTPRQPADGAAGSSAERGSSEAADGVPADAPATAKGATGAAAAEDSVVSSFQGRAGGSHSASGPGSSSVGADNDSASQSTPAASLASASDDGNDTRAERQRQRQRAKQGRQRAAKRVEAERQQEEEALLAAAAKERAEGLADQQRQQRQQEEGLLNESAALQASFKREQDAQQQKRRLAEGAGRQMPLFAVRPMLDGSRSGSSSAGAFRFDFPVPPQQVE